MPTKKQSHSVLTNGMASPKNQQLNLYSFLALVILS